MPVRNLLPRLTVILLTIILFTISSCAWSTSFAIQDGETETSSQTLASSEEGVAG